MYHFLYALTFRLCFSLSKKFFTLQPALPLEAQAQAQAQEDAQAQLEAQDDAQDEAQPPECLVEEPAELRGPGTLMVLTCMNVWGLPSYR